MADQSICSVAGCEKPVKKRRMCNKHYLRWWKNGNTDLSKTAPGAPAEYMDNTVVKYGGDECLIWPFYRNEHGYGELTYGGAYQKANRVACLLVNGEPPTPQHQAAHSCGKGHLGCVTPKHLSWKTAKDNAADRLVHGTDGRGERHPQHKLTWGAVENIRSSTETQTVLANRYGVSRGAISDVRRRISWDYTHLNPRRA